MKYPRATSPIDSALAMRDSKEENVYDKPPIATMIREMNRWAVTKSW